MGGGSAFRAKKGVLSEFAGLFRGPRHARVPEIFSFCLVRPSATAHCYRKNWYDFAKNMRIMHQGGDYLQAKPSYFLQQAVKREGGGSEGGVRFCLRREGTPISAREI